MRKSLVVLSFLLAVAPANAAVINFDDQGLTGPSVFALTTPQDLTVSVGSIDVNITGGTVLDNTAFLPGNTTAVYGTADFFTGGLNPIVITFSQAITNFYLDIYNGNTVDVTYQLSDNAGNLASLTLPSNSASGFGTLGFAATGNIIQILGLLPAQPSCCAFDFFIDNIHFNEPLPPTVPIPAALPLLVTALAGLGAISSRRKRKLEHA